MFSPKSPTEIVDIGYDLTAPIEGSDTIISASFCVTSIPNSVDPATLVFIGSPFVSGKKVIQRITGGTLGAKYEIALSAELSNGEILKELSTIAIVSKGC